MTLADLLLINWLIGYAWSGIKSTIKIYLAKLKAIFWDVFIRKLGSSTSNRLDLKWHFANFLICWLTAFWCLFTSQYSTLYFATFVMKNSHRKSMVSSGNLRLLICCLLSACITSLYNKVVDLRSQLNYTAHHRTYRQHRTLLIGYS